MMHRIRALSFLAQSGVRAVCCTLLGLLLMYPSSAAAQSAVLLVRHAERADDGAKSGMMGNDPDLSEAGKARADALARMLRDAGISAIYVTEYKRTAQTAEPLARALGIEPVRVPANDAGALLERLRAASGNVLVVGHSNTVPELIAALGVTEPVTIGDREYDALFAVTRGSPSALLRLRY